MRLTYKMNNNAWKKFLKKTEIEDSVMEVFEFLRNKISQNFVCKFGEIFMIEFDCFKKS